MVAAAVFSLAALKFISTPYVWISIAWALAFIAAAFLTRAPAIRAAAICGATAVAVLGGFEFYYAYGTAAELNIHRGIAVDDQGNRTGFSRPHSDLGYAARPNADGRLAVWQDGELLYQSRYRIGKNGLRISPPDAGGRDIPCILFFGGSMTFGVGVDDENAVHYRVGVLTEGRYRTYNFGLNGYGTHQMLAALESGMVEDVVDCRPEYVFYQAIPHHAIRASGRARWDKRGPRYVLDGAGRAVRQGNFNDTGALQDTFGSRRIRNQLDKSFLYRRLVKERIWNSDLDLMAAIIKESRRVVSDRYPDAAFHVVLRADTKSYPGSGLAQRLAADGINVHPIDAIIPAPGFDAPEFRVHPEDPHPNGRAHDLLARYIVETTLEFR